MGRILSACVLVALFSPLAAAGKSVATVPFRNNTGTKGLDFLSSSLADGLASSLSRQQGLTLVERVQLKAVLKEMELQQSGLFDEKDLKANAGKIPAQVLVTGSYSGSSAELTVIVKAIEVSSAAVVASRTVSGSVDTIFEKLDALAPELAAVIAGQQTARLDISSQPDGASVYLDGNAIGETPLVGYRITAGTHNLKVLHKNHKDFEQEITLAAGETKSIDAFLVETAYRNRPYTDAGGFWLKPSTGFSDSAFLGALSLGHSFRQFLVRLEFATDTLLNYKYTVKVPYSTLADTRSYRMFLIHAGANWHLIDHEFFSPYIGGQIGYTRVLESNINTTLYSVKEPERALNAFTLGGIVGIDFLPASRFSLFIEGRYYYSVNELERTEVESISFLGKPKIVDKPFHISAAAVGGGVRIRF